MGGRGTMSLPNGQQLDSPLLSWLFCAKGTVSQRASGVILMFSGTFLRHLEKIIAEFPSSQKCSLSQIVYTRFFLSEASVNYNHPHLGQRKTLALVVQKSMALFGARRQSYDWSNLQGSDWFKKKIMAMITPK